MLTRTTPTAQRQFGVTADMATIEAQLGLGIPPWLARSESASPSSSLGQSRGTIGKIT